MLMIIHNIVPVFAVIFVGHILGRTGFIPGDYFKVSDRLVYYIFFPVMLFWKIGSTGAGSTMNWTLVLVVIAVIVISFLASLLYSRISGMETFQIAAYSQCCYRFNTYLGLAVIVSAIGEKGVGEFGVMIGLAIPLINMLAVTTHIWYSQTTYSGQAKMRLVAKAMIANPLIISSVSGIIYSTFSTPFPPFFNNTFRLLSVAALPLALLSIGNSLTFNRMKGYLGPALASCALKLVFMPVLGYFLLNAFDITGISYRVAMIFFALPTATSAFILSSQLNSDANLASACIVLSTLLSFVSLSVALFI